MRCINIGLKETNKKIIGNIRKSSERIQNKAILLEIQEIIYQDNKVIAKFAGEAIETIAN